MWQKILNFIIIAAYVVGLLGGVGYACYSRAYFIAVCIVALGAMAAPRALKAFKDLTV